MYREEAVGASFPSPIPKVVSEFLVRSAAAWVVQGGFSRYRVASFLRCMSADRFGLNSGGTTDTAVRPEQSFPIAGAFFIFTA